MITFREFSEPAMWTINASNDEGRVVGVANGRVDGSAIILTFIGVDRGSQRQGIGSKLLKRIISKGLKLGLARLVAENIRSGASFRMICRELGESTAIDGCSPQDLSNQPANFIFAPTLGILSIEGTPELTAEWRI